MAIEFPHPRPLDWLTILIYPIRRALYHVTFSRGVGDRSIFGRARWKFRFAFVELPGAEMRVGSQHHRGHCQPYR